MFEVGFSELVVIGITALLAIGPERLPEIASKAGSWIAKARRLKNELDRAQQSILDAGESIMQDYPKESFLDDRRHNAKQN